MSCERQERLVEQAWLGPLAEPEAGHVRECEVCRAAVEPVRRARTVLESGAEESAPANLWDRIEASLARPQATITPLRPARHWRAPASVAALLLLATGLWLVMPKDPEIRSGDIPDAEFFLSEHRYAEEAYVFIDPSGAE